LHLSVFSFYKVLGPCPHNLLGTSMKMRKVPQN
jgi:hypothetical protein